MFTSLKTRIVTSKLAETRDFYVRCLGMELAEEWDEDEDVGCILTLPGGRREACLEICQVQETHDFSGLGLQFRCSDLAAFRSALPPGVETRGPVARPWGSFYLHLADPNGIAVIVYEGGL